jgi:uncharacterized protein
MTGTTGTTDRTGADGTAGPTGRTGTTGLAARILVVPIRFYQRFIGPIIPPSCRFTPSCSEYAAQALRTHGALRGLWLAVRRLLRCAPWHPGGWDPVPPRRDRLAGTTADTTAEETF